MAESPALLVDKITHHYGKRAALLDLSLTVNAGEMFALLGPNGSGKSTLFRLISTLMPIQKGLIRVFGHDAATRQAEVRRRIGVVFQNPALDKQLTVAENLDCHAHLYGLSGALLKQRRNALLERFGVADRAHDLAGQLSGGLRRRVELAKALLPEPKLLILDEPSTGLDVAGLSIVLTTHLMDEAERCSRLSIIDHGKLLATGTPEALAGQVGGDVITFSGAYPEKIATLVEERLQVKVSRVDRALRVEKPQAHLFVPQLIEAVPGMIDSISIGRPTLDDVFVHITGRRLEDRDSDR
jgi:ABC-2 type transport system ATP-binding protein